MIKVLNLYAGIGGNRKLWTDVDVTAVEINPDIAKIYKDFFPDDNVIVADAHQYLLDHFEKYDFIWSSPPCPSHSRFRMLWKSDGKKTTKTTGKSYKYPDMKLYEEIIFLKYFCIGKFCIENVISYYDPLIQPIESNSHFFWTNFYFPKLKNEVRNIRGDEKKETFGFDLSEYDLGIREKRYMINNCVQPEQGLHILNHALERMDARKYKQTELAL